MLRSLLRLWNVVFAEPLRKVEAESLAYRVSEAGRKFDLKSASVLLTVAICLTIQNYAAFPDRLIGPIKFVVGLLGGVEHQNTIETTLRAWTADQLTSRIWWCAATVLTYSVIPILLVKGWFREQLRDYGTKMRGIFLDWPIYLLFTAVMVPLVWFCSGGERFQQTYPMFAFYSVSEVHEHLWKWEACYAVQFVALEFFFRGFIVHGTKHRFGIYSVFVMTVPYCMIHFGKPVPECVASIIAGVVLGVMSLVTRSVWLGAGLHIAVAWGMDLACLGRRGLLGIG